MDNLIQLAMQIIFCLLIAALIGAIVGYLFGKMSKCDKDDYEMDLNDGRAHLNDYTTDKSSIKENISSGFTKTENLAAAGVTSVGAGLYEGTKDSVKDFGSNVYDNIVDGSEKVITSVGQEVGIRPGSIEAPADGEVDDLKEVSGVGLKIEEILNSLGIYYFEQISEWTPENIEWIENYLSVKRRVKKENWIGQAKLLAAGGHTKFSKKVKNGDNRNYN